jgi:hypothetical protein
LGTRLLHHDNRISQQTTPRTVSGRPPLAQTSPTHTRRGTAGRVTSPPKKKHAAYAATTHRRQNTQTGKTPQRYPHRSGGKTESCMLLTCWASGPAGRKRREANMAHLSAGGHRARGVSKWLIWDTAQADPMLVLLRPAENPYTQGKRKRKLPRSQKV